MPPAPPAADRPNDIDDAAHRPPGPPVTAPAKRRVVRGLLIGGALGGVLGAVNLGIGEEAGVNLDKPAANEPERPGEDNWHARAARYTGWCVFGGGLIGALSGAAAVARDRLRGGAERPPPGFDE